MPRLAEVLNADPPLMVPLDSTASLPLSPPAPPVELRLTMRSAEPPWDTNTLPPDDRLRVEDTSMVSAPMLPAATTATEPPALRPTALMEPTLNAEPLPRLTNKA